MKFLQLRIRQLLVQQLEEVLQPHGRSEGGEAVKPGQKNTQNTGVLELFGVVLSCFIVFF